jgi:hypothetical protein
LTAAFAGGFLTSPGDTTMAARQIIVPGAMPARDANGHALPSKLRFYEAGSGSTPKSVYTSAALNVAHSFPILSDSAGRFPQIWADEDETFDVSWSDQVYDATVAAYSDVRPLSDAVLASTDQAEAAADAAQAAQAAAEEAAASAEAVADTLDLASLDPISVPYITEAEATAFLATQQVVITYGYDSYDPRATASWTRVASQPAHGGWFRSTDRYLPNGSVSSADGGYWQLAGNEVNPRALGARGDGTTDDTDVFAAMSAAIALGRPLAIPAGEYRAWLYVRGDDVTIRGAGSHCTTIKLPDGAQHSQAAAGGSGAGVPCVIDFGFIGDGNNASDFRGGQVSGLTLDGNAANTTTPDSDIFGWGVSFTKFSDVTYSDLRVVNCHCGGVGTFINSNNHLGEAYVEDCGQSLVGGVKRPGFDVNSSKNSTWALVAKDCAYGARLLDNCWNNTLKGVIENAALTGFVYNNQTVNRSENNLIDLTINDGCQDQAIVVGTNCYNSEITASICGVDGMGISDGYDGLDTAYLSRGNSYRIATKRCGGASALIYGNSGRWMITSTEDGRTGGVGSAFAVDVHGDSNILDVNLTDSSPWQVRGVAFRAAATDNLLIAYRHTNTLDPFSDAGVNNRQFTGTRQGLGFYATQSEAEAASVPADLQTVTTGGHSVIDPRAAASWKRVASEPGHPGWFRSADRYLPNGSQSADDGGYWELSVREASVLTFGAMGDDVADDAAALQRALDYGVHTSVPVFIDEGTYRFGTPLTVDFTTYVNRPFTLRGAGWGWDTPGGVLTAGRGSILRYVGDPADHAWVMNNAAYESTSQNGRVVFVDFALLGDGERVAGGDGFNCTVMNNTIFDNLFVGHFRGAGMKMNRCYSTEIREGMVTNNYKGGIDYTDAGNAVRLYRVRCFGNGMDVSTSENFGLRFTGEGGPSNAPIIDQCDLSYNGLVLFRTAEDNSLTSIVVASGVGTATTKNNHGLSTGDYIAVNGATTTSTLNTLFAKQITVTGAKTFTYDAAGMTGGTYNLGSDPFLRIGTAGNCLFMTGVYGPQITGLTIETPQSGAAIYVGGGVEGYSFEGGFILSGQMIFDSNTGEGQIDNIVLQGPEAVLYAFEETDRAKIDLGRGISLVSGASISKGSFYRLEGQWFGGHIPASGNWRVGDFVSNSTPTPEDGRIICGWLRLTAGSGQVTNIDWAEIFALDGQGQTLSLVHGSRIDDVADGAIRLSNSDGGGTARLHFGSPSDSFPMLKRSGQTLHLKTGDDEAFSYLYLGGLNIDGFGSVQPQGDGVLLFADVNGGAIRHLKFGPNDPNTPGLRNIDGGLRISSSDQTKWLGLEAKFINISDCAWISNGELSGYAAITGPSGATLNGLALGPFTNATPMLSADDGSLFVQLADSSAATGVIASKFQIAGRGGLTSDLDGVFTLFDQENTGEVALRLGGNSAAFPALKRQGSGVVLRSADDEDYAPLTAMTVRTAPLIADSLPSAGVVGAGTRAFVTDATSGSWGAPLIGGGDISTPVVSDGSAWLIG